MPSPGLFVVVGEMDRRYRNRRPVGHVVDITRTKRLDRIEAMGCFEVAAAEEKTELIGGRAQAEGELLQGHWEIKVAFALSAVEQRGNSKASRSMLFRIFIRGIGASPWMALRSIAFRRKPRVRNKSADLTPPVGQSRLKTLAYAYSLCQSEIAG